MCTSRFDGGGGDPTVTALAQASRADKQAGWAGARQAIGQPAFGVVACEKSKEAVNHKTLEAQELKNPKNERDNRHTDNSEKTFKRNARNPRRPKGLKIENQVPTIAKPKIHQNP